MQGESLASASHQISFSAAFPTTIQLMSSAATVALAGSVDFVAEYFRAAGAGSVSAGLEPTWRADKADAAGNVPALDIGRLSAVTRVDADPADADRRKSSPDSSRRD